MQRFLRCLDHGLQGLEKLEAGSFTAFLLQQTPAIGLLRQKLADRKNGAPLRNLLIENRHTECSEPRDRVYALLGLSITSRADRRIEVSYTIDPRSLLFSVVDYCQIPRGHVLRWARFLIQVLDIERSIRLTLPKPSDRIFGSQSSLIAGRATGKVVRRDDRISPRMAGGSTSITRLKKTRFLSFLEECCQGELIKLKSCFGILASEAESSPSSSGLGVSDLDGATFSNVTIEASNAQDSQLVLAGVVYGKIDCDHKVVQFIGNDMALVIDGEAHSQKISGCLLIMSSSGDENSPFREAVDPETGVTCQSYTLQSEADCSPHAEEVNMELSYAQILALAQ